MLAAVGVRRDAGRAGRRSRAAAAWLLVAAAVGGSALLRDADVATGPVAALAPSRVAVQAELVVTSDPRPVTGRYGDRVMLRGTVRRLEAGARRIESRAPVLVIGDDAWRRRRAGQHGRRCGAGWRRRTTTTWPRSLTALGEPVPAARAVGVVAGVGGGAAVDPGRRVGPRTDPSGRWCRPWSTGDDHAVPEQVQADFRTAGLTHLLAVSGTNLTLVVGFLVLARAVVRRARPGPATCSASLGIVGFVLLARTEPSVVRAAAMGTVALLGLGGNGRDRGVRALGVAVTALLLWDPWLATSVGFALSACWPPRASCCSRRRGREALARWLPRWAAQAVAVPVAAQLVCTPVVAALSGQVSLVAVVANLLAAPLVAPATVLGLLGGLVGLVWPGAGAVLGWCAGLCAPGIVAVAEHSAGLALPAIDWGTGAAALAVLTVALPRPRGRPGPAAGTADRPARPAACSSGLVVLVPLPSPGWPPRGWVFAVCDVGQGDALVVRAGPGSAVVVDAGPDPALVDRCLDRLDVERVPLLVLTHFHADHVDGLAGVYAGRRVGEVDVTSVRRARGAGGVRGAGDRRRGRWCRRTADAGRSATSPLPDARAAAGSRGVRRPQQRLGGAAGDGPRRPDPAHRGRRAGGPGRAGPGLAGPAGRRAQDPAPRQPLPGPRRSCAVSGRGWRSRRRARTTTTGTRRRRRWTRSRRRERRCSGPTATATVVVVAGDGLGVVTER